LNLMCLEPSLVGIYERWGATRGFKSWRSTIEHGERCSRIRAFDSETNSGD
jgi:hypothetical protein